MAAASFAQGAPRDAELSRLAGLEASEQIRFSLAGRVGHIVEPLLEPLGFDWRIGVGIMGAFAAREVFVSTLGIVFGIEEADEESQTLRSSLQSAERADGSPLMTPLTGVSLMVFFVLACQCMSTIVVVRKESGTWRWPLFMFAYMSVLAYVASLVVYQGGPPWGGGSDDLAGAAGGPHRGGARWCRSTSTFVACWPWRTRREGVVPRMRRVRRDGAPPAADRADGN